MILKPEDLGGKNTYKLATAVILPRPIAWVSTQDKDGVTNVAPYSFFTVASTNPLTLLFCPQTPGSGQKKDTLRNIIDTGEFVVNITNEATAVAMNDTATTLPYGTSEFDHAGITPAASSTVAPPRVAEAPVAFECKLDQIVTIGSGATVFGTVTAIYVQDDVYVDSYVQLDKLQPIGRLMGNKYVHITDIFELIRG